MVPLPRSPDWPSKILPLVTAKRVNGASLGCDMWNTTHMARGYDAVVIGAGVVGTACAYFLSGAGLSVAVLDRGWVAGGTSGAGEGNILVSDKELGPELELALFSVPLWRALGTELGPEIELEPKGGVVVAATEETLHGLHELAAV